MYLLLHDSPDRGPGAGTMIAATAAGPDCCIAVGRCSAARALRLLARNELRLVVARQRFEILENKQADRFN